MAENSELEALDQLVNSDGWRVFTAMVQNVYGRSSDRFYNAVEASARGDNPHAQDHLRQIIAEQRGALEAVALAANRIKILKGANPVPQAHAYVGSRRGNL